VRRQTPPVHPPPTPTLPNTFSSPCPELNLLIHSFHKPENQLSWIPSSNLARNILKRLFPPRTRRPVPVIPLEIRPLTASSSNSSSSSNCLFNMEINVFKLCSGLKVLGYLMILLVAAIIAVSYQAVVIVTCGPQLLRGGAHSVLAFAIIMIFHFLVILSFFV